MKHGDVVTFAGTQFLVEVVNERYTRLRPVSDPGWLMRHLEAVEARIKEKEK